jgi:glycosyltransferase involved in cell wall biosynthesis
MKICVFTANEFMNHKTFEEMKVFWKKWGHEVYQYNLAEQPTDDYLFKIKHYQVYEGGLNYAESIGADILYFDNLLTFPEYLLAELEVRPNYKPKIVFIFAYRESYKSKARANVMARLIDKSQVKIPVLESFIGNEIVPPRNFLEVNPKLDKIKVIYDKHNYETQDFCKNKIISREKYDLPKDKFILLFFGRITKSKGIDLIVKAMDKLGPEYFLFIKGNLDYLDFELNLKDKPNIKFINGYTPEKELGYVFSAADVSVMPYRWQYAYGSSGNAVLSSLSRKPMILSSIYPLNKFIKKFNLGRVFENDYLNSLVEKIIEIKENYDEVIKNAKFEEHLKLLTTTEQMAEIVAGKSI